MLPICAKETSFARAVPCVLYLVKAQAPARAPSATTSLDRGQAAPAEPGGGRLVGLDVVVGHIGQEHAGRRAQLAPAARLFVGEQGLQGHVETDHGGVDAGAEHGVGGIGVLTDIDLGPRADQKASGCTAASRKDIKC